MNSFGHFKGKSIPEHLREARKKGMAASQEMHGQEATGSFSSCAESAKDTSVLLLFLSLLFPQNFFLFFLFSCGFLLWKSGKAALLGWSRLERLHRLIEEERWEIEHHRTQEREELKELYQMKGFEGKLLEEVLDVLMADDNRLLHVMLEEELGVRLEVHEHPLKLALFSGLGVLISAGFILVLSLLGTWGAVLGTFIVLLFSTLLSSRAEKNHALPAIIWTLATCSLAYGVIYFAHALSV